MVFVVILLLVVVSLLSHRFIILALEMERIAVRVIALVFLVVPWVADQV